MANHHKKNQHEDDDDDNYSPSITIILVLAALACSMDYSQPIFGEDTQQKAVGSTTIQHNRRPVLTIFRELGPVYSRRAYRMSPETFYDLHLLLLPSLRYNRFPAIGSPQNNMNGARNGLVPSTIRLAAALRYFAGGSVYDLAVMHRISCTEVYRSIWRVVDAVNSCDKLKIEFPTDHLKQKELANGFASRSSAGFDSCIAAIDGLLV
jgi:hypothetical protein